MSSDVGLIELRDDVLRKIGRNVVYFQKMEGMLKRLIAHQDISGPLNDIKRTSARARKATAKQSMGRLAERLGCSVFSGVPDPEPRQENAGGSISISIGLEADPADLKERRKALAAVVQERNRLIHQWLAALNPDSIESLGELGIKLDEQHARIKPEFENLKALARLFLDALRDLKSQVDSDESLKNFRQSS